jgi:hypothetical protein
MEPGSGKRQFYWGNHVCVSQARLRNVAELEGYSDWWQWVARERQAILSHYDSVYGGKLKASCMPYLASQPMQTDV